MATDANAGIWAREEGRVGLRSRGRIDFGLDHRKEKEDDLVLGFQSIYCGLSRKELASYGEGIDLRMDF